MASHPGLELQHNALALDPDALEPWFEALDDKQSRIKFARAILNIRLATYTTSLEDKQSLITLLTFDKRMNEEILNHDVS